MQKNDGIGMTVALKEQLEDAVENGTGLVYVDPKFHHHYAVIGRTREGMSCFAWFGDEKMEVLTFEEQVKEITTVLESYDEDAIAKAIEKNHLLDFKNLSEEDVEKTVMFLMEKTKEFKPNAPYYLIEEKHKSTMLVLDSQVNIRKAPVQKQPDYRKFEKKKRF